jgi:hypothetical protein
MGWDTRKSVATAVALCLLAGAALSGCGGEAKPTSDEVNAGYLQFARRTRELTHTIDHATERSPGRPGQLTREFRSFASNVDSKATYLLVGPARGIGSLPDKAFVFQHSLVVYESVLRAVVKRAHRGDRSVGLALEGVRQAGAKARVTGVAWERALRAAIAD